MKKFFLYLFFLILPFILTLPFPLYCLYVTGELMSFDSYIRKLDKGQLWGLAYSYYDREYKFYMTEYLKPDILELGTSRSMQINENIFNKTFSFYNAGGAIQNVQDYEEFIKKLNYNPKLIIFDLNQFFFNPNAETIQKAKYVKPERNAMAVLQNCYEFYEDFFIGKIYLDKLRDNRNIGMMARMTDDGFTDTGFRNYGKMLDNPKEAQDYNFKFSLSRIDKHILRFQTCNELDTMAVKKVQSFLRECKKRKIFVVGFLPPFAHKVFEAMKNDGNYKYLSQIYTSLLPLFDGNTQFLFDHTDVSTLKILDKYFIDGFHAGVVVDNTAFKNIITSNKMLSNFFVPVEKIDSINKEYMKEHPQFHYFSE